MIIGQSTLELYDCVNTIENTYNEKGDIRSKVIIENKASGISINTELKRKFKNKMNVFLYNVKGKKEDRLRSYEGYFQSGKVKLVKGDWNEAFIAELTGYPDVPHDESIDCITMALNYYLVNASRGQRKMEIY
jgi:predicted phage terminase large subunit-like protein